MNTVVKSASQTVEIGHDRPFVIIGERINPTGRKKLAAEMQEGNFDRVVRDAKAQIEAGAHILDVNVGVPSVDPETTEPEMMTQVVELVQSVVDAPLAIDSSVVPALVAGIRAANGRPIVNSVTGEEERMERILPVVAEYNLPVIAITSDERGILFEVKERFGIAKKIVERAAKYGIKPEDVLIDPLAMPVSSVPSAGLDVFAITHMVNEELGCNTVCGASNISFGLPNRLAINSAFMAMAIATGMTCAITNPLEAVIRQTIYATDVLMGRDEFCMNYVTAMRKAAQQT
jgi:5-methyltetrahydrofolate--homocysteine methyltransferase